MRCANADELYRAMLSEIRMHGHKRVTTDSVSACKVETVEARIGSSFELVNPLYNVVTDRSIDLRWAFANVLHFFSASEEAEMLAKYNKHASKYVTNDGKWRGAYGAIAMPQLDQCIAMLQLSPHTRAAVVSMGDVFTPRDVNRPACWSILHFMSSMYGLAIHVYQRSCSIAVMPYDLVALTNVLKYVADAVGQSMGSLHWTFGSLHMVGDAELGIGGRRDLSLIVPPQPRHTCLDALRHPEQYPWADVLTREEVRS